MYHISLNTVWPEIFTWRILIFDFFSPRQNFYLFVVCQWHKFMVTFTAWMKTFYIAEIDGLGEICPVKIFGTFGT